MTACAGYREGKRCACQKASPGLGGTVKYECLSSGPDFSRAAEDKQKHSLKQHETE